jgi:hypothetical protein
MLVLIDRLSIAEAQLTSFSADRDPGQSADDV